VRVGCAVRLTLTLTLRGSSSSGSPASSRPGVDAAGVLVGCSLMDVGAPSVAVVQPGAPAVQVALAGDCRVYRLGHTDVLEQVTTDHTRGEQLRQLGFLDRDAPPCAADSVVTSRLACGPIGSALVQVELTRRLLLCSDGVGKQLDAAIIGLDLGTADHAAEAANWLAADADVDGVDVQRTRGDNITAVYVGKFRVHLR
jgi:serine/threonine protein phosphatase PrpC